MRITHKICSKCKIDKDIDDFHKSAGRSSNARQARCKECMREYAKSPRAQNYAMDWRLEMQQEVTNRTDRGMKYIRDRLWYSAKSRAKQYGVEFNITKEDIVVPARCPVLGLILTPSIKVLSPNSPTLDRFDNSQGYVPGNITVISSKANAMKSSASIEEVELLLEWMKNR
jgi:hypothetical protein